MQIFTFLKIYDQQDMVEVILACEYQGFDAKALVGGYSVSAQKRSRKDSRNIPPDTETTWADVTSYYLCDVDQNGKVNLHGMALNLPPFLGCLSFSRVSH